MTAITETLNICVDISHRQRIYNNLRLRIKTKLKLLPVSSHHLEFWGEGITVEVWRGTVENFTHPAYTVIS